MPKNSTARGSTCEPCEQAGEKNVRRLAFAPPPSSRAYTYHDQSPSHNNNHNIIFKSDVPCADFADVSAPSGGAATLPRKVLGRCGGEATPAGMPLAARILPDDVNSL